MLNRQYEKACVTAATMETRFEIEHKLKQFDEIIAQAEATVARLYEERREFVNLHNLNRAPEHCPNNLNGSDSHYCPKCTPPTTGMAL